MLAEGNVWKNFVVVLQYRLWVFSTFHNGFGHARIKKVSGMHELLYLPKGKLLWKISVAGIRYANPLAKAICKETGSQ